MQGQTGIDQEYLDELDQQRKVFKNQTRLVSDRLRKGKSNYRVAPGGYAPSTYEARRLGDGQQLPKLYALRMNKSRDEIVRLNGGNEQTEQVVKNALTYLARYQSTDGRWDSSELEGGRENYVLGHDRGNAGIQADTGVTGLAVLAFLGAGHSHLEGEYRETVRKGLEFLIRSQKTDGSLAGDSRLFASMYCHGMATLALSEAFALTGDKRLKTATEKAIGYSVRAQHPNTGGWRYRPGDDGDMSQFGWQVIAVKSASMAGIDIPQRTFNGMSKFVQSCSSGKYGGLSRYRPGEKVTPTMTAEALCCRAFLNQRISENSVHEAAASLLQQLPSQNQQANYYYWYYATIALYQVGGEAWNQWNSALISEITRRQIKTGPFAGSFNPDSIWGGYGGRAFTTAMAALSMEVYYRYLPVLEK